MKIVAILAVLLLASCTVNPGDPDALRAEAARIERATARAYAGTQAAQVEQERKDNAARMATQGAAEIEIQAVNAQANATIAAITNQQAALDLALEAGQATKEAWADNLRVTQTMAGVLATQTVQPTAIEASKIIAASRAERAMNWTAIYPILLFLLVLGVIGILVIFLRWTYRRTDIDIERRQLQNEINDRQNGAVNTKIGLIVYRPDAQLIDRAPLNLSRMDDNIPYAPSIAEPEQADSKTFDLRERAIDLLERSIELNGATSNRVASWSALDISSESWQKTIEYLKTIALVYTIPNKGTYTRDGITLSDVIYRLEETSPTPLATVREREGAHG